MGTPYKIPKKLKPDSSSYHMMSPLSRVQGVDTSKSSWTQFAFNSKRSQINNRVNGRINTSSGPPGTDRSILPSSFKSNARSTPCRNGTPSHTDRTPSADCTSPTYQSRWRPRRASDTLCQGEGSKDTPAIKKQWGPGLGETWKSSQNDNDGEEKDFSPAKTTKGPSPVMANPQAPVRSLRSIILEPKDITGNEGKTHPSDQTTKEEVPGKRVRTTEENTAFSMPVRKAVNDRSYYGRRLRLRLSLKTNQKAKSSSTEPIVLSSDDEDGGTNKDHSDALGSNNSQNTNAGAQRSEITEAPTVIELPFSALHFGSTCSHSNGPIMITDESITIPLKDGDVGVVLAVVPSELHGYGVWDGALAGDGTLLSVSQQPSPSVLFLSLSDAQTRLLYTELSAIHSTLSHGQPCPFMLVTLASHMDELQSALLASLMDVIGLRYGRSFLGLPLSWADGLNRLHCHPRGRELLTLLGQGDGLDDQRSEKKSTNEDCSADDRTSRVGGGAGKSSEATITRQASLRSHTRQQSLPRRLIQYPPPPSKGGITVTTEDLECLRNEEFLNDVIIDFYLKYLQLERADQDIATRSHIFSSFFYKQLTRKDNSSEEEAGGTAQYRRHRRVKTWTRHVDIFSKDYLFIPVNQEAHWYLVVICFPGLLQVESMPLKCPASVDPSKTSSSKPSSQGKTESAEGPKRRFPLPDCTLLGCQRENITRRPCILIMDSLKLSNHHRIYSLLREYLQIEWEVRRGTPRYFTDESIKGSHCKVPLQDNSSDCGVYLLQYVESFLQNPVVHFELPLQLERWFPRQQVWRKRDELRELVLQLYQEQGGTVKQGKAVIGQSTAIK